MFGRSRWVTSFVVLLLTASIAFVIGVGIERNSTESGGSEATHTDPAGGESTHSESGEEGGAEGSATQESGADATGSSEEIGGVNTESTPVAVTAVLLANRCVRGGSSPAAPASCRGGRYGFGFDAPHRRLRRRGIASQLGAPAVKVKRCEHVREIRLGGHVRRG